MRDLGYKKFDYKQNKYHIRNQRKKLHRTEHFNTKKNFFANFDLRRTTGKIIRGKQLRWGTGKNGLETRIS